MSMSVSQARSMTKPMDRPMDKSGLSVFDPASLNPLQWFLDGAGYDAAALQTLPVLDSREAGTLAVPRGCRCYLFDGADDYATVVSVPTIKTFACWVKAVSVTGTTRIVSCMFNLSGNDLSILNTNGTIELYIGNVAVSGTTSLTAGTATHFCVSWDGTTAKLYKDGVEVISGTCTPISGSGQIVLGSWVTGTTQFFSGRIWDVRIYSTAKTAAEVLAIYNQHLTPTAIDTTSIIAHWPCQEESGTIGYDASGNGRHLTLTNITASTFHATDTGVKWSYPNEKGYTDGENLLADSEVFGTSWFGGNIGVGAPVVTANAVVAPDGATTAESVVLPAISSAGHATVSFTSPTMVDGRVYTVSAYLKGAVGGETIYIMHTLTGSTFTSTAVTLTTSWQRFSFTFTAGPGTNYIQIGVDLRDVTQSGKAAQTYHIWGWQVNAGATAKNYTKTGSAVASVILPAISPTLDVSGGALQYPGRIQLPATTEVPCVTGDGTAAYADLGSPLIPASADFSVSCWYRVKGTQYSMAFTQGSTYANNILVWESPNNVFQVYFNSIAYQGATSFTTGSWVFITLSRIGSNFTFSVNGVTELAFTNSALIGQSNTWLHKLWDGTFGAASVCDLRVTTGGITTYFPLQDGPGSSNTNRDIAYVKSDGTGGVVSNALTNGTVASIWANRCPSAKDWSIQYGGGIAANGAYVAGRIGGANDAAGNAKTLAAGKHGNPYSRIVPNYWGAPALQNLGVSSSTKLAPADSYDASTAQADDAFNRIKADGSDRYFAFVQPLSGANLTNADNYVL